MLGGLLGNVNERGTLLLLLLLDLALSAFPEDMPAALEPILARLLTLLLPGQEAGQVIAGAVAHHPVYGQNSGAAPSHCRMHCRKWTGH